jgi:hypothetical protein
LNHASFDAGRDESQPYRGKGTYGKAEKMRARNGAPRRPRVLKSGLNAAFCAAATSGSGAEMPFLKFS